MFQPVHRLFQRYRVPVLVTLSGFIVPLITNLTSSWLEVAFGQTSARLIQLIAILVALSVALFGLTVVTRLAPRRWSVIPRQLRAGYKQGLIVLVGPGKADGSQDIKENPAYIAIDYHRRGRLRQVWIITTERGTPAANQLIAEFESIRFEDPLVVYNPLSVSEAYQAAQKILQERLPQSGLSPDEVIADFSGGTRPMSVGVALACANLLPMQFVSGSPGRESVPLQTDFRPAGPPETPPEG